MKIIHVTDELMPSAGGLVSVPINLAAAQAELGHEVVLLGRTGKAELTRSSETCKIPHFDAVTLVEAQHPGLAAKIFPTKARFILKKHITPGCFVHLHGVWDPLLLLASHHARKVGAQYVVTPHSMLHPWQMRRFVFLKKVVFAVGWRRMFNGAAFVHTLTKAERTFVEDFGFDAPTEIIPNGVYQEAYPDLDPNPFPSLHPELGHHPYILFLSRLGHQKGISYLLEGFERYANQNPEIRLVIAGPDYGELGLIKKTLRTMRHADRVLLPGPLYGEDKLGALRGAACFALTSRNEGFSVALLEALACGLPVVISENCFFPEIGDAGAGLICSLDASEISDAFTHILTDEEYRRGMAEKGVELVTSNYLWRTIATKSVALYEKYHD